MSSKIKAGFSKVDITPRIGVELSGFGPYLNRHSTVVLEKLYARAMAVEVNAVRWVMVSCDLLALNADLTRFIRKIVCESTGLKDHQVMVHATHTHSGPCTVPEFIGWGDPDAPYLTNLPRFVAEACILAVRDLGEAVFFCSEVDATGFSYNRELEDSGRTNEAVLENSWVTDKPEATDTTALVIRVERGGKLAGFLTYFSCHPVVCGEENREIHGDFVGVATNRIEKEHPGAIGLFLQGALGDINSNYVFGPAAQSLVALEMFAARFAQVIHAGLNQAEEIKITKAGSAQSNEPYTLSSPSEEKLLKKLSENEKILAGAKLNSDELPVNLAMVYVQSLRTTLGRLKVGETIHPPLTVQSLRLGPITFTSAPMELMHQTKQSFQTELRDSRALLLSITNGYLGYAALRDYYKTPPERYPTYRVPYLLGLVPFTEDIEEEVLAAALKVNRKI